MDHHLDAVRAEMHATIDRLVDDWRSIEALAGPTLIGGESRGGTSSEAERGTAREVALAGDWVERWRRLRVEVRLLDGLRAKLAVVGDTGVQRGRVNTVEVCGLCQLPAPKVRRIDGAPYCATSCFYRVWRQRQRVG